MGDTGGAVPAGKIPEFKSALDYTTVRDFAYQELHPLYYGAPIPPDPKDEPDEEEWEVHQKFDLAGLEEPDDDLYDSDEIYCRAMALFDFAAENDNEIDLMEGQVIWVTCRHGQGWLLAENIETRETGLVPEEYVQLLPESDDEEEGDFEDARGDLEGPQGKPEGEPKHESAPVDALNNLKLK